MGLISFGGCGPGTVEGSPQSSVLEPARLGSLCTVVKVVHCTPQEGIHLSHHSMYRMLPCWAQGPALHFLTPVTWDELFTHSEPQGPYL